MGNRFVNHLLIFIDKMFQWEKEGHRDQQGKIQHPSSSCLFPVWTMALDGPALDGLSRQQKKKSIHPGRSCVFFILRSVVLQHRFKHTFRQQYRCSCLAIHKDVCADCVNEATESCVINVYIGILLLSSFMNIQYCKLVSPNPGIKSQALVIAKGLNRANDLL